MAAGFDDFAIGAPFESVGAVQGAGAVNVLDGSADGLTVIGNRILTEGSAGVRFGFPLAIGDFSNDVDDLAVAFDGGPEIAPHHRFHL